MSIPEEPVKITDEVIPEEYMGRLPPRHRVNSDGDIVPRLVNDNFVTFGDRSKTPIYNESF